MSHFEKLKEKKPSSSSLSNRLSLAQAIELVIATQNAIRPLLIVQIPRSEKLKDGKQKH